jgi:hypothetical protein
MQTITSKTTFEDETNIIRTTEGYRDNLFTKVSGVVKINDTPDTTTVGVFTRSMVYLGSTTSNPTDGTYTIMVSINRMPLATEVIVIAFDQSGTLNSEIADHILPILHTDE